MIEIGDDGRGLNIDRIRNKCLENGLATEAELDVMPNQQIYQYIFNPGFSTAEKVTSVSGRGVGMDVVRTNIEKIGGTIELTSELGNGSTFTIKIPLTLAIVSALIVECAEDEFFVFRDTKPFDICRESVLPYYLKERPGKRLRIWCTAPSSGQEPCSMTMILTEMKAKMSGWNVDILGTDLSTEILDKAIRGTYSQCEVQRGLPFQLLVKYFEKQEETW